MLPLPDRTTKIEVEGQILKVKHVAYASVGIMKMKKKQEEEELREDVKMIVMSQQMMMISKMKGRRRMNSMKTVVMNQQMHKDYENEEREMSGEKNIEFFRFRMPN